MKEQGKRKGKEVADGRQRLKKRPFMAITNLDGNENLVAKEIRTEALAIEPAVGTVVQGRRAQ